MKMPSLNAEESRGRTLPSMLKLYLILVSSVVLVIICPNGNHNTIVGSTLYQISWKRKMRPLQSVNGETQPSLSLSSNGWRKNGILYELPEFNISILSAVGRNRSLSQEWNEIVLNGWEGRKHFDKKLNCCFHYQSGETSQVVLANKNPWLQCKRVLYTATQFTCQNPGKRNGSYPDGVYLTTSNSSCNSRSRHPITIHYPQKQANASIALCTKIAYGSISSRLLTEWYEIQKQLGVNKVVTFLYNLTDSGLVVLKHYQEQGFVDLLSYQFPHTDFPERRVGDKTAQVFNDEQVVAFDCAERLAGYQYVGLLDHDEFIIPSQPSVKTWKHLLKKFLQRKPNASGFVFRTELFITDWGMEDNSSEYFVTQYRNRTKPMWDREKTIYMSGRVVPGSVWTHNYTSVPGYEKFFVPSGLATLKHYRSCRQEWLDNKNCFSRRRFKDQKMIRIVERLNKSGVAFGNFGMHRK